jgi:hypothetical protein
MTSGQDAPQDRVDKWTTPIGVLSCPSTPAYLAPTLSTFLSTTT